MTCRNISMACRIEAERIFEEKLMKKISIDFDCGQYRHNHCPYNLDMPMHFDRFSEDGLLAYFKESQLEMHPTYRAERPTKVREREMERWIKGMDFYIGGRFDVPSHIITIGHRVNDTELPDLEYYKEDREISFDWREMLQCYYREDQLREKMLHDWGRVSSDEPMLQTFNGI